MGLHMGSHDAVPGGNKEDCVLVPRASTFTGTLIDCSLSLFSPEKQDVERPRSPRKWKGRRGGVKTTPDRGGCVSNNPIIIILIEVFNISVMQIYNINHCSLVPNLKFLQISERVKKNQHWELFLVSNSWIMKMLWKFFKKLFLTICCLLQKIRKNIFTLCVVLFLVSSLL